MMCNRILPKVVAPVVVGLIWTMLAVDVRAGETKGGLDNAVAIRKALDQKITLDIPDGPGIATIIEHLSKKTKLKVVIDKSIPLLQGLGLPGFPTENPFSTETFKVENARVRDVLQSVANRNAGLTYVVLRDTVLITTEQRGYLLQMQQRVNVAVKDTPLVDILNKLADETGATLLIDPRVKADTKITLRLDNVTLETAVRLLTEFADLGPARVGSVLFVTTEARAEKLRKENASNNVAPPVVPAQFGNGFGGMGGLGGGIGGLGGGRMY